MEVKTAVLNRLANLSKEELLGFFQDDRFIELVKEYFDSLGEPDDSVDNVEATSDSVYQPSQPEGENGQAKRPLNCFIAFRTYYLKLFPDVTQKAVSGFLTSLWQKDPYHNRWSLIAKVYSFIRDQIGKDKVSLPYFLSLACPTMNIIPPGQYLATLGWTLQEADDGTQAVVQSDNEAPDALAEFHDKDSPSTEMELLSTLVSFGYLPEEGFVLVDRMRTSRSGIMTTIELPYTPEKLSFIETIRSDPIQATRELLQEDYDEEIIQELGVNAHNVEDVNSISHLSMQLAHPHPARYYQYGSTTTYNAYSEGAVLKFENIPDTDSFDIDSPWDMDVVLGQSQSEGQRSADHPPGPAYSARQDFHYRF